jgi:hypothetical protein
MNGGTEAPTPHRVRGASPGYPCVLSCNTPESVTCSTRQRVDHHTSK